MAHDVLAALSELSDVLEGLGLEYVIGGSHASGAWGEPRMTNDVDLLIELPAARVEELFDALKEHFYVDESEMRGAVREARSFNAIHLKRYDKLDLFVAGDSTLDRAQLDNPPRVRLTADHTRSFPVTAPEVVVLRKLDWFQRGDRVSDRQWRDVLAVLRVQRERLDLGRMWELAAASGLEALLAEAFDAAWGGPTPS